MISWESEQYLQCLVCNTSLLGRVIGPRVEHQLKCSSCSWTGNTDKLRLYRRREFDGVIWPQLEPLVQNLPPTEFVGYDTLECESTLLLVVGLERKIGPRNS